MALLDIFKKKKKKENKKEIRKKSPKVKTEKKLKKIEKKELKDKKQEKIISAFSEKKAPNFSYRILKIPHITEKATSLTEKNQYIFRVFPRANKTEIKKAVENLYGVDVLKVNIIKIPAKQRRIGRIEGRRKGYKKAIVKIKEGQKIEVLPR